MNTKNSEMKKKADRVMCYCSKTDTDPESFDWSIKDVQTRMVKAESFEGTQFLDSVNLTNFDPKFHDRYWRIENIHLIQNNKLYKQYEEYRKDMSSLGRTAESIQDTLLFSVETEKACKDICRDGYKVGSKKRHVLGHTGSGVHLVQHYDILTRYLTYQQYSSPTYVLVFKTFLGKQKPIVPRLHRDENYVSPNAGFDCHVSARQVDKRMNICEALNCSYVYLYEFDDVASNTVKYPRQILPCAILQLVKKKVPIMNESPFLAVGPSEVTSSWEVKGETRRGFRFMFSKSGLKGRHKVFAKDTPSAPIESYLKGQILEMRTKPSKKTAVETPPTLQRIEDVYDFDSHLNASATKPPSLQKVLTNETISSTHDHVIPVTITKPLDPSIYNAVKFPYMHLYPQLSLKPIVKLKRLQHDIYKSYTKSLSHVKSNARNSEYEETNQSKTNNDTEIVSDRSEIVQLLKSKNPVVAKHTNKMKESVGIKAKTRCETRSLCRATRKSNKTKIQYGVKTHGPNTMLHRKKNIFKPSVMKRRYKVNQVEATKGKIKKCSHNTFSNDQEYTVEVNGDTPKETCSSVKVKFTRKSADNDCISTEMPNYQLKDSTSDSKRQVTKKEYDSLQENNSDVPYLCANANVDQSSLPTYSLNSMSKHSCSAQTSQCSMNSNPVVIEKSKSPVIANAAPDMLNITPELASAQIYPCNDKVVENSCDSIETAVKYCDKIPFDVNESNLAKQPHVQISQSMKTKKDGPLVKTSTEKRDKDNPSVAKHPCAVRKGFAMLPNISTKTNDTLSLSDDSRCEISSDSGKDLSPERSCNKSETNSNVSVSSNEASSPGTFSRNTMQTPPTENEANACNNLTVDSLSEDLNNDQFGSADKIKESMISKHNGTLPNDKLLHANNTGTVAFQPNDSSAANDVNASYGESVEKLITRAYDKQSQSSSKPDKLPTTFSNATVSKSNTTTASKVPSCASGTHLDIEYKAKVTNSVESGRACPVPKEDEGKTNVKVDTLTATRLRSFLGSRAAAALKHRKSVSDKKTTNNYSSVANALPDIGQAPLNKTERSLESKSRCGPEMHKDRTFLSPKLLLGTDSTDDNDSQHTVIGGLSLSPVRRFTPEPPISLHEMHSNVKIHYFDHKFTPSTYRKETSASNSPIVKIERDDTYVPLSPQSAIDSAIDLPSTTYERTPLKDSCNVKSINEEVPEATFGDSTRLSENTSDIQATHSGPNFTPPILPRTQQELTRLNASQSKSAIVDTLKELSTVLKYLTENSGQSKRDVAFVAEKMCKTLSSVPSKKRQVSSCSEVSSSVRDDMLMTTQPVVKIKQEPLEEHDYVSSISQTHSSDETAQHSANYEPFDIRIKKELPDTSTQTEMSTDIYSYLQHSSSKDECRETVDTTPSERTISHILTSKKTSKLNEVWNKCVFHDEDDLAEQPYIPCTISSDRLHYLLYPSEESDILQFESFGNEHENSFTKGKQIKMIWSTLSSPVQFAKKEATSGTQQKPKSCSLTIKSGFLNKGLKFNSQRRKRQMKTLSVKQFPSIISDAENDTTSECQTVPIKTENTSNEESFHSTESLGLVEKTGEVDHANVYLTVCQKIEELKECRNEGIDEQPTDPQIQNQEASTASSMTTVLDDSSTATPGNVTLSDYNAPNEQITENKVPSKAELSHLVNPKGYDSGKRARKEKVKKKDSDVIPFHTVIRLKRLQYMRYKRGESEKKFIDYRDVFSKQTYRNRNYRKYRSTTNTSHEESKNSVKSDDNIKPTKLQETGPVKNNDNLAKKINYFIPKFKNSAISNRGTALIEDKFRNQTVDSLPSKSTKTSSYAENHIRVNSTETPTKERRSLSHKRESVEHKNDSRSNSRRSRSKSSHRSQKSDQTRKRKSTHSPTASGSKRKTVDKFYDNRYVSSYPNQPFDRKRTNISKFTRNQPFYKSTPPFGKSSFARSGTGYFSWRRKYQPNPIRRNMQDDVIVTATGKVLSQSEYIEWTKFKQREDLRLQIESAIKEYRKTFEFTADDQRGDQKVASYLHLLTDKLDEIQNKRDKVTHPSVKSEPTEKIETYSHEKDADMLQPKRRANHLIDKLERSKSFNSNVAQQHSSISKFSNSLASDSNKFSYKQRQYEGGIEAILKQHLEKHCQNITKQIKQEITDEIEELHSNENTKVNKNKFKYKTKKPHRENKNKYYTHTDKGKGFVKHSSSRSRERDETDSRCSSEKADYDGKYERSRRDRHVEPRPSGSHNYKEKYDPPTKHRFSSNYNTWKDTPSSSSYKRDTYKRQHTHDFGKGGGFDKFDFQQNYDRYQNKGTDKFKTFRPYKYKPWFQGKYDKSSSMYQHKDTHHRSNSDRDYNSHFKKDKHLDDNDEFNAARYVKFSHVPYRGRGRGRGSFRGRAAYHTRYEPAKYSKQYLETNYRKSNETKRDSSKGCKVKSGSHPNFGSKLKYTVSAGTSIEVNTNDESPKPIPIVCSRRS